jgi:hypothetical protein
MINAASVSMVPTKTSTRGHATVLDRVPNHPQPQVDLDYIRTTTMSSSRPLIEVSMCQSKCAHAQVIAPRIPGS